MSDTIRFVEIRPPHPSSYVAAQVVFVRRGKRREFREVSEHQLRRLVECLVDMRAEIAADVDALAKGEFIVIGVVV